MLIAIQMHYRDYDLEPDEAAEGLEGMIDSMRQGISLESPTFRVRSNRPGWIAINGNAIYQVGDVYWLSNRSDSEDIPGNCCFSSFYSFIPFLI